MCGICGFYSGKTDSRILNSMNSSLTHRGPDDSGLFVDKNIGLAVRRLSIIDLKKGHQPIHNEDKSIWVVFNGEIYNFVDLRKELEKKGHRFYTNTDTEVIVHSYEEYGNKCIKNFNGMFAFALWDNGKKLLFIARDRLGIKPLYYYFDKKNFIFGSELKAVIRHPIVPREINPIAVNYYMGFEYVPAPITIFKNIKKLYPGHTLIYKNNRIIIEKYWDINNIKLNGSSYKEQLHDFLADSVDKMLVSDVPLGAFLSGGIDSSYIVAIMSNLTDTPVETFSIGFDEESYSELDYAKQVAKLFNTNHREKILKPNVVKLLQKTSFYFDEPFADASAIPTFLISEMARKYVKVALSGDGGDELFAGYDRYLASKIDRYYYAPRFAKRKIFPALISKIKPKEQKKGFVNLLKRFAEGSSLKKEGGHMRWQYFLKEGEEKEFYSAYLNQEIKGFDNFNLIQKYFNHLKTKDILAREQYVDLKTYLSDAMLVKIDRASMANSLEVRVPYLDHRLVEFAFSIPSSLKLKGFKTKYILKKTASRFLPNAITGRKKQGFSIPIKKWLREDIKDYALEVLKSRNLDKFFVRYYINKLIAQHMSKSHDHSHKLWALINFQLWHDNYANESAKTGLKKKY